MGGAEIARVETYREGRVPLHTLRANIDYATATAHTTYGCVGVKCWIYKGEVFEGWIDDKVEEAAKTGYGGEGQDRPRRPREGGRGDGGGRGGSGGGRGGRSGGAGTRGGGAGTRGGGSGRDNRDSGRRGDS